LTFLEKYARKKEKKGAKQAEIYIIAYYNTYGLRIRKQPILMCTLKLYVHICQRATLPPATFMINLGLSLVVNSEKGIMIKKLRTPNNDLDNWQTKL